ncbi:hypothetical protein ONS96_005403 [Cadophora gregata f. sp. sojae]|nr:hypothetical protein ONS96_005403 [Cadophora gregata f. sp. sojae]
MEVPPGDVIDEVITLLPRTVYNANTGVYLVEFSLLPKAACGDAQHDLPNGAHIQP